MLFYYFDNNIKINNIIYSSYTNKQNKIKQKKKKKKKKREIRYFIFIFYNLILKCLKYI